MAQKQRISRRSIVRGAGTALAVGAALATGMVPRTTKAGVRQNNSSLVGTWIVTSTRAGSVPNGILVRVMSDGGFIRTGNTHPTESPALGVWQQVDDAVYDVTYRALQFDSAGMYIGQRKGLLHITLDPSGDSFTGLFRIFTFNLNDEQSAPVEGQILGTRMVAEAFS